MCKGKIEAIAYKLPYVPNILTALQEVFFCPDQTESHTKIALFWSIEGDSEYFHGFTPFPLPPRPINYATDVETPLPSTKYLLRSPPFSLGICHGRA